MSLIYFKQAENKGKKRKSHFTFQRQFQLTRKEILRNTYDRCSIFCVFKWSYDLFLISFHHFVFWLCFLELFAAASYLNGFAFLIMRVCLMCFYTFLLYGVLNRPFATKDHMVHGGGQAHYYSRTGTLKQRDLNQWSLTCLCFDVPVRE